MTRRRRAIGLATVGLIAAAAVAVVLALGGGDGGGNGPLYSPDADETTLTIRPGGRMTWGQPIYFNASDRPLKLISARPASLAPGLQVIGARAAGQDRTAAVGVARGFPPAALAGRPVGGLEVAPEATSGGRDGVEFLIGLSARKPGRYVARGLEVTYEQGGSRYRETMPDSVSVCVVAAPASLTAGDCAFPGKPPGEVG